MDITIKIGDEEASILRRRAKKNMLNLREQVEDIVRRSCVNAKKITTSKTKSDDRLVDIFSRDKRGKSRKKKK